MVNVKRNLQRKYKRSIHCARGVRIRSFSGPYFASFGLNRDIYSLSFRIQSEPETSQNTDQKNSKYGHFSHSDNCKN